jgi:hypothetical protein
MSARDSGITFDDEGGLPRLQSRKRERERSR